MNFKILDLFSGAGGFSCGLDSLDNFETVVALDFNEYAIETFSHNFPNASTIVGDILEPNIKNQVVEVSRNRGVNMIIGGPPCQGFSNKGKKLGLNDPRNYLFLEYLEIVREIEPDIFIIENVKSMITAANGYFMNEIQREIESLGYFSTCNVLNSKYYGVPQSRERAFIIAYKHKTLNIPEPDSKSFLTVRDAISDLSYLNSVEGKNKSFYIHNYQSKYQKELREDSDLLYNHIASKHSEVALKKLALIPPECGKEFLPPEMIGNQKFKTTWGRLIWDEPSPTIDTRFDTPSNGKNSHPFLNRAITPREAARIQSFPDKFQFFGRKTEICKQIGNAVPPKLAKKLGESINMQINKTTRISNEYYKLFNGDSYDVINEIKNLNIEIDHIITDPPYNISKNNNFSTMKNPRKGVDFGDWDKEFDLYSWIKPYTEILNKNGSIIIFCSYRYISHFVDELEKNNLIVKDIIKWEKSNPMPRNITRRYVQDTEFAIWAVKKKSKWTFNKPDDVKYLRANYQTSTVSGKERTKHPTQKSLKLMEDLIKVHTNSYDTILDLFMGSGTTGVAALNLNRKFIGVEIDENYFNIAKSRISSASNLFNL